MNFYEFTQNNSGGSFDVNENVAHRVIIEANSEEEANKKFETLIEDQSSSCPCCGDRWYAEGNLLDLDRLKKDGYETYAYTHYKEYEKRWFDMYGHFNRKEDPYLYVKYTIKHYGAKVYPQTIEQYAEIMAQSYGWTTPDCIIHFSDGKKTLINKKITDS